MKSKALLSLSFIAIVMLLTGCGSQQSDSASKNQKNMDQNQTQNAKSQEENVVKKDAVNYTEKYNAAEIETSLGKIKVKFYNTDAPITVNNFMKLSDQKFYEGTKFHRVIKNFMIQGGDPNSKTGDSSTWGIGGPGYKFNDELKGTEKYPQGTLAMANSGPNTNGSQFFIVTASPEAPLPPSYTVFGTVISGMDTALKIENVKTVAPGQIDRPVEDVVIKSVTLLNEK
jgi:cyclophilin family peptidyl-prolyl cis-trans isomerase